MTRGRIITAALVLCAGMFAAPAAAQTSDKASPEEMHFGVRGGVSGFPNQFFLGGHVDAPQFHFKTSFRPSVEIGFRDHTTLISLNLDLVHWMPFTNTNLPTPWRMYAGAGVGANIEMVDEADNEFFGNLSAVFGFQHDSGLFAELRVGMRPSAKIAVGFVLR
jgi:hypothetical protein